MTAVQTRSFELMSTVTFHTVTLEQLNAFTEKLSGAVGAVLPDYPAVVAFVVEADTTTGDVNYGLRFQAVDPQYVEEIATEILEKAVELVAEREGAKPVEAEREESVLVLTR